MNSNDNSGTLMAIMIAAVIASSSLTSAISAAVNHFWPPNGCHGTMVYTYEAPAQSGPAKLIDQRCEITP